MLRGEEGEQGPLPVLQRGHPVAHAFLGIRRQVHGQLPDVLEGRSLRCAEPAEVVVHRSHGQNDTRRAIPPE